MTQIHVKTSFQYGQSDTYLHIYTHYILYIYIYIQKIFFTLKVKKIINKIELFEQLNLTN